MCGGKNKKYRKVGNECRLTCCLIVKMVTVCQCSEGCPTIGYNVLGIAEGGEIEAESFDFAPRRAKTNFYELNLQNKNE